jgi:hypothetical protein
MNPRLFLGDAEIDFRPAVGKNRAIMSTSAKTKTTG